MTEPRTADPEAPEVEAQKADALEAAPDSAPELVSADLLVEDVSIDGMCGVY